MGKAVDAFSKYFLCLKCKSCSGTTTTFAFPPFPGNFGLTIFQCFRFSRYVALRSSSLFSQCLCNWGVRGMHANLTARPGAVRGRHREVQRAQGLVLYTRQWGHTHHLLRTEFGRTVGLVCGGFFLVTPPCVFIFVLFSQPLCEYPRTHTYHFFYLLEERIET